MKRVLSLLLVVCVMLSLVACVSEEPNPTVSSTQPTTQVTDPTDPKPTETQPTDPKPTEPEATEPEATEPAATETQPTEPEVTEPEETEPEETEPEETEPEETEPSGDTQPVLKYPATSPDEIQIGTATIDGIVDDAYLNSLRMSVDYTMPFNVPVESLTTDEIRADVFFLHDGKYLYIVANVTGDSKVVDTGLTSWVSESVEVWFSNPAKQSSKLVMDAFATPVDDSGFPGGSTNRNEDKLKIYQKGVEIAAKQYDHGYVVEAKIQIPYFRKSEGSLAINVQLNNRYSPEDHSSNFDFSAGGCYGTQPARHDPIIVYLAVED